MKPFILSHPLVRPLYGFLRECNESPLEKEILDCGAGGNYPPLALFREQGYRVVGIDSTLEQIQLAREFCRETNLNVPIMLGDIRNIPFRDESMNFVYSVNTVCHLSKKDTATAVQEIRRVLKNEGLCFVNFVSVDDCWFGRGKEVSPGEFLQEEEWYSGITKEGHICSYYEDTEPDAYFEAFEVIRKEKRITELVIEKNHPEGGGWQMADICYTAKKV
ncbi:MAG: class I SAM-dependent methyltransferase [Theionarchaea archaeon]|nr:class I SAM-dependent methyltransferase [Theionarchaea archaeon]MBU7036369.1 class I SAM-dependent methyltransferase [Theionarchaea archaeon]